MRKRILSIMLTLCMVFSLLPQTALAEEITYTDGGNVTTTGLDLSTAPGVNTEYTAGTGKIFWQPGNNTVILQDAQIDTTTGSAFALTLKSDEDVTIEVEGNNVLNAKTCGIGQVGGEPSEVKNTAIKGSGALKVTTTVTNITQGAICLNYGNLTISEGVKVTPVVPCNTDPAIYVYKGDLSILQSASITADSQTYIKVQQGTINIDTDKSVTESIMYTQGGLNYFHGDVNAWVLKDVNIQNHAVHTVYGDYTLTGNQTILDFEGEDGLTVMEGATLTINDTGIITVEDEDYGSKPQITNNGNIMNNGKIQFQTTATDDMLLALTANGTLTGSGVVFRGGTEVAVVNGAVYEVASDLTDIGLDFSTGAPAANTCYKAGSGYILWQPAVEGGVLKSGTVTLHNASINTTSNALKLPGSASSRINITLVAEGENSLISTREGISHEGGETLIQGSGKLNIQGWLNGIFQQNGDLTITGDVTVTTTGSEGKYGIITYGLTISDKANVTAKGGSGSICGSGNITINTTGTVNAPEISTIGIFDRKAGTMTGSWVLERKGEPEENEVNTVYGNVTIVGGKTVSDQSQLDGLTIMEDATLTIDNSGTLTIGDSDEGDLPKIINNGKLINNGTIQFPEETDGSEMQKIKNITGSGTIKIGDKDIAIVNGVLYPNGGEISNTGVDFTVDTPTVDTYYKAGDSGYMIFSPTNGTLTMHNAQITGLQAKSIITLPKNNIKLVLEGENALTNMEYSKDFAPAIQQGELPQMVGGISALTPQPYSLTVSGNGSLAIITDNYENYSISTDGTFVMESGTLKSGNTYDNCFGIETVDFKMTGGRLEASLGLKIFENALVQGGTIFTPGGGGADGMISTVGNFEVTGGTVTCGATSMGALALYGDIIKTGGTLNALVSTVEMNGTKGIFNITPYGSAPMVIYDNEGNVRETISLFLGNPGKQFSCKLNIPAGNTLTIPKGATLDLDEYIGELNISDYVTNNGTLVNNGTIVLPVGSTAEEVKAALAILKPMGMGMVKVPAKDIPKYYTNSGNPMNAVYDLSLDATEESGDGYTWAGNSTDGFTLTLDNLVVTNGSITLPCDSPVTMILKGNTVVEHILGVNGSDTYNLTIGGSGTITLNDGINCLSPNGGTVTIQGGATVTVGKNINITDYSGRNGELIVDGKGTSLSVTGESLNKLPDVPGVMADTVQVLNGAQMTVRADEIGVVALEGGVTVTGGSTLNVGCDYGVYIIDGKLTVDSTSKLITNGLVAPFCVVDTSNSKSESDMVSIANKPSGTSVASVVGSSAKYWSLAPTGGALTIDESQSSVILSGAVEKLVTFAASKKSSDDSSSGGGGGSVSSSYTITAKAEKGGTISPDGEVSVSKNADKTFTITANKGYEVKDVLVDGVSVGKVTEYTFDDVTKAHTITASFVEVSEEVKEEVPATTVSYSDVKNSDWFKSAVDYVTEKGLMSGISDKEFGPNISTTRGMIVTILWRLEGQPSATAKANFTDVAQGEYYAEAVAWAAENKIVDGYGNGLFGPNDIITREQLASILYRYSKFKGYDTTQDGTAVSGFSDYSQISSWAGESASWAVNAGLISGTGNSQLDPRGSATRAQVASILMRYCENMDI